MRKKLTTEEFIKKAIEIHGDKYNYNNTVYIGADYKVKINCPEHGEFEIRASAHLGGQGCRKCGIESSKLLKRLENTEKFLNVSNSIHNNFYNYDKSNYINQTTPLIITCPIHGDFLQAPREHIVGHGCKICGKKKAGYVIDTESFINKAKIIHNNFYDYSKVVYKDNNVKNIKVTIICPKHGEFEQSAESHLKGHGCLICAKESRINNYTLLFSEFVDRSNLIHHNKYKYIFDKESYSSLESDVQIICPIHGIFIQKAYNHINGSGCIQCNNSKGENEIKELLESYIDLKYIYQFKSSWLDKLSIDFYLIDYNIAIEYQGEQHYYPIDIFGGDMAFIKQVERDIKKRKLCEENNVRLIEISYKNKKKEMNNLKEQLDNLLLNNQIIK